MSLLSCKISINNLHSSKKVVNFLCVCLKFGISSGSSVCFVVPLCKIQTPHDW